MCCEDVRSNVWPAVDFDVVAMGTTHVASPAKNAYAKKSVISRSRFLSRCFLQSCGVQTWRCNMPHGKGPAPPCRFNGLILRKPKKQQFSCCWDYTLIKTYLRIVHSVSAKCVCPRWNSIQHTASLRYTSQRWLRSLVFFLFIAFPMSFYRHHPHTHYILVFIQWQYSHTMTFRKRSKTKHF